MRGESADGQVGSRAQPPVEAARARTPQVRKATAEPRSPADAAGNWRRNASRGGGPRQRGHRRATTHATVLTAKKAGGPVGQAAARTPQRRPRTQAIRNTAARSIRPCVPQAPRPISHATNPPWVRQGSTRPPGHTVVQGRAQEWGGVHRGGGIPDGMVVEVTDLPGGPARWGQALPGTPTPSSPRRK